jgi:O-Antigen ligase
MIRTLFVLGMIAIPFSGVVGLPYFGEAQHELSFYFFMPAIFFGALSIPMQSRTVGRQLQEMPATKLITAIALAAASVIILSFLVNAGSILTGFSHGRYAIEKFVFSFIVILYCFMLAYLTFVVAGCAWAQTIYKPIAISAVLCAVFSVFEILSRHFGIATSIYSFLDGIVHGGYRPDILHKDWDLRIRSLAFEPPALGNYAGFAWPWLTAACFCSHGRARFGYITAWGLLTALMLYSGARTGIILLAGSTFVLAVLRFGYLPSKPYRREQIISHTVTALLTTLTLAAIVFFAANFQRYEASVISGSSVSDISRLASIETAFNIFLGNPIFGVGLGQFAFYLNKYVPQWGHLSWEMVTWLTDPQLWPSSYSVYARLAAELGVFGLVAWTGLWIFLARKVLIASLNYQQVTGMVPAVANPLIVSCFGVLFSGFTTDTFRTPMIWVTLGLCCRYLFEVRVYASKRYPCSGLGAQVVSI